MLGAEGDTAKSVAALEFVLLQVSEERLIELLEQVNQQAGGGKTRVTIQRRRTGIDDDDY